MEDTPEKIDAKLASRWDEFNRDLEVCTTYIERERVISDSRNWCIQELMYDVGGISQEKE